MDLKKLDEILIKYNQKPYRRNQILNAVFKRLINNWDEASDISSDMKEILNKELLISDLDLISQKKSKDGTIKALLKLRDGFCIESVLMTYEKGRNTVCVSSMAGCPMGCRFCATGNMGFKRNLSAGEICDQVLWFAQYLKNKNEKIDNVVLMGMGEPFLNYENVIEVIKVLNDNKNGFGLGSRKISVSTCGIPDKIRKFAKEPFQANLAISLHSIDEKTRSELMPINKTYSLKEVMKAVEYYTKETNRKVMFEYLLIKDINDSLEDAKKLAILMNQNFLFHLNLIKYHGSIGGYKPSSNETRQKFFDYLKEKGVSVTTRMSFGEDIFAACGQLKV